MIRGDQSDRKEMRVQNTALPGSAIFSFTFLLGMPHGRWGIACARKSRKSGSLPKSPYSADDLF
jgi:hypothetical protein